MNKGAFLLVILCCAGCACADRQSLRGARKLGFFDDLVAKKSYGHGCTFDGDCKSDHCIRFKCADEDVAPATPTGKKKFVPVGDKFERVTDLETGQLCLDSVLAGGAGSCDTACCEQKCLDDDACTHFTLLSDNSCRLLLKGKKDYGKNNIESRSEAFKRCREQQNDIGYKKKFLRVTAPKDDKMCLDGVLAGGPGTCDIACCEQKCLDDVACTHFTWFSDSGCRLSLEGKTGYGKNGTDGVKHDGCTRKTKGYETNSNPTRATIFEKNPSGPGWSKADMKHWS
jgi:hypothetical protein